VIDRAGYEIDYLPVEVATITALDLDAQADGLAPMTAIGFDAAYQVPTGADLELDVSGRAFGNELLGEMQYLVELDQAIAGAMRSDSDVARGHLHLTVPAGDHSLRITAPGGTSQRVLLRGL
jgi:hypothetical protein